MNGEEQNSSPANLPLIGELFTRSGSKKSSRKTSKTNLAGDNSRQADDVVLCADGICLVTWKPQRPAA